MSSGRSKSSILDKPLSKGKGEVSLAFYALLFSEIVQYCQNRSHSIQELQNKLSDIGHDVGTRLLDLYFVRERNSKREIKLLNMLLFVKSTLWKVLFGKEADKLEHANDDERTYYIIEKDALFTVVHSSATLALNQETCPVRIQSALQTTIHLVLLPHKNRNSSWQQLRMRKINPDYLKYVPNTGRASD
ncbi:transport protein particle (TRAPP) component domain-containing protein [Phthorimaea operculella]|nr:transport protein particle (TRAPP) component domain-containing protein [Phthorimaea operculella]